MTENATHGSMMNIPLPDSTTTQALIPDGKEHGAEEPGMFPGMPVEPIKLSAMWQGNTLEVVEAGVVMGGLSQTRRRYFLSESGAELIELVESRNGLAVQSSASSLIGALSCNTLSFCLPDLRPAISNKDGHNHTIRAQACSLHRTGDGEESLDFEGDLRWLL